MRYLHLSEKLQRGDSSGWNSRIGGGLSHVPINITTIIEGMEWFTRNINMHGPTKANTIHVNVKYYVSGLSKLNPIWSRTH